MSESITAKYLDRWKQRNLKSSSDFFIVVESVVVAKKNFKSIKYRSELHSTTYLSKTHFEKKEKKTHTVLTKLVSRREKYWCTILVTCMYGCRVLRSAVEETCLKIWLEVYSLDQIF